MSSEAVWANAELYLVRLGAFVVAVTCFMLIIGWGITYMRKGTEL